jgi:hypothetical protein
MVEAERYIEEVIGCRAILMLTSQRGGQASADQWRSDVLAGLQDYLKAGGSPYQVYLNAWYPEPVWSTPDEPDPALNPNGATKLGTFRLVDEMLRAHEAGDPLNIKPDGVDRETSKKRDRKEPANEVGEESGTLQTRDFEPRRP